MGYRRDRDITGEIPAYRRMLAHVTPGRFASEVVLTQRLDLSRTLPWLEQHSAQGGTRVKLLHLVLCAAGRTLHDRPRLNRYVSGTRFWQRDGVTLTVSAKKALEDGARIVMLKLPIEPDDGVREVAERLARELASPRAGEELAQEKENRMLLWAGPLLPWIVRLALWLERRHWLPAALVDPDPLYTSMVVANLGSVGLGAAQHHLYEWGNCPFFLALGRIEQSPVVVDGVLELRPSVELAWTFDERIEDGLACSLALERLKRWIEDPEQLGT